MEEPPNLPEKRRPRVRAADRAQKERFMAASFMTLAGLLVCSGLTVGFWTTRSEGASLESPTAVAVTATATVAAEPTKVAKVVPTLVTAPTVESFKKTDYIWAMRYMADVFKRIAPYYGQKDEKTLAGLGIALILTETDANTDNWFQIEEATEKESLADLKKRTGNAVFEKMLAGQDKEEISLIAACSTIGKEYQVIGKMAPDATPEMRRSLLAYSYNGGLPLTMRLWGEWQDSPEREADGSWESFNKFAKRKYPLWGDDVDVYKRRVERLGDFATQWTYDLERGDPPTNQEVQDVRHNIFLAVPARARK